MNKNDLIFDWSNVEAHAGWKGVSVLIAGLAFIFFLSAFTVQFDTREISPVKSASVLYVSEHEEEQIWRVKAEEEGPFPGRMEISSVYDPLNELEASSVNDDDSWNSYSISMRPLLADSARSTHQFSTKGQRVFPRNFKSSDSVKLEPEQPAKFSPILIAYTKESEKWLPTALADFDMEKMKDAVSAEWRFVINLRADGSVIECLSLSGGKEEELNAMTDWLKGLRFQEAKEQERWMGLRIEFSNERSHGSDAR